MGAVGSAPLSGLFSFSNHKRKNRKKNHILLKQPNLETHNKAATAGGGRRWRRRGRARRPEPRRGGRTLGLRGSPGTPAELWSRPARKGSAAGAHWAHGPVGWRQGAPGGGAARAAYCPMAAVARRARAGAQRDAEVSAPDAVVAARSPTGHVAGLRGGGRGAGTPPRGGVGAGAPEAGLRLAAWPRGGASCTLLRT